MKSMFPKGRVVLRIALLILIALALWMSWRKDELSHLKKTAEVTSGTDEAIQTVRRIVAAAKSENPKRALAGFMYVRDSTELERITAPLLEQPPLGELSFLGCDKLVVSHLDNIAVHTYSAARGKSYAFYLNRDKKGVYKLADLGYSKRRP